MNECRDFFHIFKGNMEALGLDVPTSWFGAQATTLANVSALIAATEKLGKTATVSELAGATLVSEKLLVAGACMRRITPAQRLEAQWLHRQNA